jgi:hypothetical protein
MNQKEATAKGFIYGAGNAQKVLKKIKDHVVWSDHLTAEERHEFDRALLILDALGSKYRAEWDERVRRMNEANRRRHDERMSAG